MTDTDHNCHFLLIHVIGRPGKISNWGIAKSNGKALEMDRKWFDGICVIKTEENHFFMVTPLFLLLK